MDTIPSENRLALLINTKGFNRFVERLNLLLDFPVWWYCAGRDEAIQIFKSHDKRGCGLLHDDASIRENWMESTYAAISQAEREKVALMAASPPDQVQVVIPVFCGEQQILGYIGMAHLPAYEQQRLQPLLPLMVDHMRQIAERKRAEEDLKGVRRLWRDVVSTLDLEILEERILREISALLDSTQGILIMTDAQNRLVPRSSVGFENLPEGFLDFHVAAPPYENKMLGWNRSAEYLPEGDPIREWVGSFSELNQKQGVWAVPLRDSGKLYGLVLCVGPSREDIDPQMDAALETLALGASAAVRNAQEFEQMRQKAVALSTVHSVYRLMSTTRECGDLLQQMANLTIQVLNVRKCSVMLVDGEDRLVPHVQIGLEAGETGTRPLKFGEELPGKVANTAMSLLINDVAHDDRISGADRKAYPSSSYLSVPLFEDDVVGVITVADRIGTPSRFVEGDREVLNTLAEQAVIALLNIQYFEKQERIALKTMETFDNLYEWGDPDKEGHALKLAKLVDGLAQALKIDARTRQVYRMAAFIHEVSQVLTRDRHPTGGEKVGALEHVELSMRMARKLELGDNILPILRDHMEHYDGSGIPRGLRGEEIPLGARLLSLAHGHLRQIDPGEGVHGLSSEQSLRFLEKDAGKRYDPHLLPTLREYLNHQETTGIDA
jgi:HD-GYP domain-containing protein (c-di-GMP phosphodiesterase class II)